MIVRSWVISRSSPRRWPNSAYHLPVRSISFCVLANITRGRFMLQFKSVKAVFGILLCASIVWPGVISAQKGQTSAGTDFWLSFMPNYLGPADNIRIFIGSGTLNKVQVDVYGGSVQPLQHFTQTVQPDGIWTLTLSSTRLAEER